MKEVADGAMRCDGVPEDGGMSLVGVRVPHRCHMRYSWIKAAPSISTRCASEW